LEALAQIDGWPAEVATAGVVSGERRWVRGPTGRELAWASVTKPFTAMATLIAAEEGIIDLDEPAGPEGSTVRHLLAHASGLPFQGRQPIARPGDTFTESVTALTPATVASCDRAVYESFVG
jgi:CubicO group peptidase (beta-lactamase class C family)